MIGRLGSGVEELRKSGGAGSGSGGLVCEEMTIASWDLRGPDEWKEVRARWADSTAASTATLKNSVIASKAEYVFQLSLNQYRPNQADHYLIRWLAHAELSTYSKSPSILPPPLYLSHQFTFGALLDDYQALLRRSDLNLPASKIEVRKEVVIRGGDGFSESGGGGSGGFLGFDHGGNGDNTIDLTLTIGGSAGGGGGGGNPGGGSSSLAISSPPRPRRPFDEPLAQALDTTLDYNSASSPPVLPALPNGLPTKSSHGGVIADSAAVVIPPMRRVAGEGLGRLRKEFRERIRSPKVRAVGEGGGYGGLEFDEQDEIFFVDGLHEDDIPVGMGEPLLAGPSSTSGFANLHSQDPSNSSSDLVSFTSPLLEPLPILHSLTLPPPATPPSETSWVRSGEEYREAVEEDARFDDVVQGVLDEERQEREALQLQQQEGSKKKSGGTKKKGKKR